MCKLGCVVGESGVERRYRTGVEGLLPLLHLGPNLFSRDTASATARRTWPSAAPSTTASTRRTGSRSRPSSGLRCRRASSSPRASSAASQVWTPERLRGLHRAARCRACTRSRPSARKLKRFFSANSLDTELDAAGRVMVPAFLLEHAGLGKEVVVTGAGDCLEVWDRGAWARLQRRARPTSSPTSPPPSAMLVDMTTTHVPVLAGELDRPPRPAAGRDRRRLHVRRRRPRAPGRRPPRARRRRSSPSTATPSPRSASPSSPPRSRAARASSARRFAEALERAARRGRRAPTSSTSTSACPRCRSTRASAASPTPTTRRWTCAWTPTQELTAADVVNEWDERRLAAPAARLRRGALRAADRPRDRARARATAPLETTNELVEVVTDAIPAPARFAGGHPAKRVFQAIRIAVNDELGQLDAALPAGVGAAPRPMADLQGFRSTRWKTAA